MNMLDYQKYARTFANYSNPVYAVLGLSGESGEVAEKYKKMIRDNNGVITEEFKKQITLELGDVLWYISNIAQDLDIRLDDIAQANIDKLTDRKMRGVINGSGDNR